jgi:hypothetical protein
MAMFTEVIHGKRTTRFNVDSSPAIMSLLLGRRVFHTEKIPDVYGFFPNLKFQTFKSPFNSFLPHFKALDPKAQRSISGMRIAVLTVCYNKAKGPSLRMKEAKIGI